MKQPCVYILSDRRNGKLYIGVTAYLLERVWMHKNRLGSRYVQQYGLSRLVYYEFHASMPAAIRREKQMKKWYRKWKINLIESNNPSWDDLYMRML